MRLASPPVRLVASGVSRVFVGDVVAFGRRRYRVVAYSRGEECTHDDEYEVVVEATGVSWMKFGVWWRDADYVEVAP